MILSVQNLTFSYADHTVLEDVSFDVDKGEFLSLLGPNGVGKSTLFRCMLGTLTGYRGRVLVEGQEIRTLPQPQRARRIAYIPQIHRPTFGYTVLDTSLPLRLAQAVADGGGSGCPGSGRRVGAFGPELCPSFRR